ncbi:MAG: ribosome-associated heat shock protein Hsp15 [Saprospiraceae bacterium]|jgi:ribosome-associated heat shock protein Hsp15
MDKVRVDKWLWAVRIFKSRTLATETCKSKNVAIGEKTVKPSVSVQVGNIVHVKKEGFNMTFKVVQLLEKRVGASIAITCYENLTSEDEMNKFKDWFVGKAQPERRDRGAGRPTKRERRDLEEYKDGFF